MNRLVIANAVKQSMTSEGMDRHGLRPRDDGAGSRSACGIGSETGGIAMTLFFHHWGGLAAMQVS
ncbi:MAG: hypothetical protein WA012_15275 [Rhodoferax sp.]|uniref:hypothetical protein n=2 Tax=Rhodoferax sp. TaxID=50421 RepID=UPI003BB7EBE1